MKRNRIIALLLTAVMLLSVLSTAAFAAESVSSFSDMPKKSHWSYAALAAAVENGLLSGSGGKLSPNAVLTRSQMAAVLNRAFGATAKADISGFTDVPKKAWYATDIAKAVRMGTFMGSGNLMRPEEPISRQEAFSVLSRAFMLDVGTKSDLDKFSDKGKVAKWAIPEVAAMVRAGYVNGSGDKLNPLDTISRAEFAQVLFNLIKEYFNTPGEYTSVSAGNLMINTPGVVLKDVTVSGDLIVGEGVDQGEAILDNVQIEGRLVIRGGGLNSVIIRNRTEVGSILVAKTGDGGVRVRTEEGCRVDAVVIDDGQDIIVLEGTFNQVSVNTDTPVELRDAKITGLTVKQKDAEINANGTTNVTAAQIDKTAENAKIEVGQDAAIGHVQSDAECVEISGEGDVGTAQVNGSNSSVNTVGTNLVVGEGAEGVTENGNAVNAGTATVTGSSEQPGHVHSYSGIVTVEPGCETEGVMTYVCDICQASHTVVLDPLGHDFDEGTVTRDATAEQKGEILFRCRRDSCDVTRAEEIEYQPFACNGNSYTTLDEALAAASENPQEYEIPELGTITVYPQVSVTKNAVVAGLTMQQGYTLKVESGASLTVTGEMTLAHSTTEYFMYDSAQLRAMKGSSLRIGDRQYLGEDGVFALKDAAELFGKSFPDGELWLRGTPLDVAEGGNTKPFLWFDGCVDVVGEAIFGAGDFSGAIASEICYMQVLDGASLDPGTFFEIRNDVDVREGGLIRLGQGYNVADGAILYAEHDADVVLGENAVVGQGAMINPCEDGAVLIFSYNETVLIPVGESAVLGGVIEPGFSVNANGIALTVPAGTQAVNAGQLTLSGSTLTVSGLLFNTNTVELNSQDGAPSQIIIEENGSLCVAAFMHEAGFPVSGRVNINADCSLTNNGELYIASYHDEEIGISASVSFIGGHFVNETDALVTCDGDLFFGTSSQNSVSYEGGERVTEGMLQTPSFCNNGEILISYFGSMIVDCDETQNNGSIDSEGFLLFCLYPRTVTALDVEHKDGEPQTDEDWNSYYRHDDENGGYWSVVNTEIAVVKFPEGGLENNGTIRSTGTMLLSAVPIVNNGTLVLDGWTSIAADGGTMPQLDSEDTPIPEQPVMRFQNNGQLIIGSVTEVGEEFSGSDAHVDCTGVVIENNGAVLNNGGMNWTDVAYVESEEARLETYNSAGFEIIGGSLTVPSGAVFKNEGYMKITDRYGEEYVPCDLSGFEDFFTVWNTEGNDSHWCDFAAEVYDLAGYYRAIEGQDARPEHMKYNRLDIRGDITFTEDEALDDFREYWVMSSFIPGHDGENGEWIDGREIHTTVTVPQGVTLTVCGGTSLHAVGEEYNEGESFGSGLAVHGTLRILPFTDEIWDGDNLISEYVPEGSVTIWDPGAFVCDGTVDNGGTFEVYYSDDGEGNFSHRGELVGLPENAKLVADVRSEAGLRFAAENELCDRIAIREDCVVTLTADLTLPDRLDNVRVEPGSGLVVPYGITLTDNALYFDNSGDITVWGKMTVNGQFRNNQNLEVGAIASDEQAVLSVGGTFENTCNLTLYPTGTISVLPGAHVLNYNCGEDAENYLPVQLQSTEGTETELFDIKGLSITTAEPVSIHPSGSFLLNGILFEFENNEARDATIEYTVEESGDGYRYGIDFSKNQDVPVTLSGENLDLSYLRLGGIRADISRLVLSPDCEILIDSRNGEPDINIGSYSVTVDGSQNTPITLQADSGAHILLVGSSFSITEDEYFGTNFNVAINDHSYQINPHIFGFSNGGTPSVYIGIADEDVQYALRCGFDLPFLTEIIPEDNKTHLWQTEEGSPWFEAGEETDPGLCMTIVLPSDVTVDVENVPVKPEWLETIK